MKYFIFVYDYILLVTRYTSEDAVGDLVAGITVGLTVIPQALAYAGIAGIPPQVIISFYLQIFFSREIFVGNKAQSWSLVVDNQSSFKQIHAH